MKRRFPKSAAVIVAGGAALALAGTVGETRAHETAPQVPGGLRCAIVTHDLGDAVEISGTVTAERAVDGSYALTIRQKSAGGQAMIDQSGDFSVAPGRTVRLGEAVLGGSPGAYKAELDLIVDGQRLRCRGADHDTDL